LLAARLKVPVDAMSPEILAIAGGSAGGSSCDRFALVFAGQSPFALQKCLVFPKMTRAST
jgi:hypothetical protein